MTDANEKEADPKHPMADEATGHHKKELDHKQGDTHGPTGNPAHPAPEIHRPQKH